MGLAAVNPDSQKREGLAVQGVGWISNRYFTR